MPTRGGARSNPQKVSGQNVRAGSGLSRAQRPCDRKRVRVAKQRSAPNKTRTAPKPAAPSPAVEPVRRVPTQERSRLRLERILEAANHVFAEVGYDAATTEQIAERAGTSIGSVYQFFPNKSALFEALCESYLERAKGFFESLVGSSPPSELAKEEASWIELVDNVIDAFWRFHVDQPGFRAVWVHQNISAHLIAAGDAVNVAIASRAEEVMAAFAPEVSQEHRRAAASIVVETISAILFVAVRRDEREAERLVVELKTMVRAYLSTLLAAPTR